MQIAVIGQMRSGTTVFRQWLGSPATAIDLGEVFHNRTGRSNNYWEFLFRMAVVDSRYRHPEYRRIVWELFIEEKHKETGAEILVLDLKIGYFNYVMNYDGANYTTFCLDENTKIIFLTRRNVARMVISRYLAERSNRWFKLSYSPSVEMLAKFRRWRNVNNASAGDNNSGKLETKIAIDPVMLVRDIKVALAQNEEILRLFGDRINAKVVYEDLFDRGGGFDERIVKTIAELVQIPEDYFHPTPILARQSSESMLDAIENAEEVLRWFRGTKYEWMFEDAQLQDQHSRA